MKSDSEEESLLQSQMKNMLTVTGFPRAIWHSVQFTAGVRKQSEILRERIRQQAGGDEIEMERLERELDLTEEELDMEAEHFDELRSRLSPTQQTKLSETMKKIRALEDVRDTLSVEEQRRINLQQRADDLEGKRGEPEEERWQDVEDNTPPGSPRVGEEELERREVAWEDEPRGYWGDHMLEEQGIEMQALGADVEAPFGANMSRVMQVGKKFAPKVVARMEQMGEAAVKKMGWVSEALEDGTTAFLVKAGTWATELGVGATIGIGMQMLGEAVGSRAAGTWLAFTGASAAALIDGNPSFLIMTGIATGISALSAAYAKQRARERSTDHPEAKYGQRFGFVRDGKKWYPAYEAVDVEMYGGLGVDRNDVVMVYGENFGDENVSFMMDSDSKLTPTWTKWHKIKILREPRDKEMVGESSTLHGQSRDGLRDWYFLSPEETGQLLLGGSQETPMYKDFKTHDDNVDSYLHVEKGETGTASLAAYQKNLLDLKYSADLMRDYNYRFHKDYGTGLGITESARGLQRLAKWYSGDFSVEGKWKANPFGHGLTQETHLYELMLGDHPEDLHKKWGKLKENGWLMDTLMEQMTDLVHTQQVAAQEAGYPNVTTEERSPKIGGISLGGSNEDNPNRSLRDEKQFIDTKIPYRSYLDLGKALPVAQGSDELQAQLRRISGMTDRTYLQQNYLAQKAYTRYLMNQVSVRGGSDDFVDKLYRPARIHMGKEYLGIGKDYHEDWGKERFHNYDDTVEAMLYWDALEGNQYLPPWATADDDGLMPDFMRLGKGNTKRIAKNESTLKLAEAEHLPLSHTNGAAPDKLYSFSPDDIHTLNTKDTRLHMDWQRKNPYTLAEVSRGSKVRGYFPRFKSGEEKAKRLKQIAKQHNAYGGSPVLVHNLYNPDDPYFERGYTWTADHFVKDEHPPERRMMNPMHGPAPPPPDKPAKEDLVVDPTKRHGYYWNKPGYTWNLVSKIWQPVDTLDNAPPSQSWTLESIRKKDAFGKHDLVERPHKTAFEKQPDDKGAESRKKELEHERYMERFKASTGEAMKKRHEEDDKKQLRRERLARGMSQERWDHYLRTHDGKTPDEVQFGVKGGAKPKPGAKPAYRPHDGMRDYRNQDLSDPKDPWNVADLSTVWDKGTQRWVDATKPIVPQQKPLAPPKHAITPWHAPVHDHIIHGPLPGSRVLTNHVIMHHDPEPPVYEDAAPAFIPMTGQPKMDPAPSHIPPKD